MRVAAVTTHVVRVRHREAYLGAHRDGSTVAQEGYEVRPPWRSLYSAQFETVLVEVRADDGTTGWGEALAPVGPEVVAAAVSGLLAPQLIGSDAVAPRVAFETLRNLMRERGHLVGHQADALAAVDIALWDLAGRLLGVPVATLFGGAGRDRVPTYVSGLASPHRAERAALAAGWASRGASRVKLHAGHGVAEDLADVDAIQDAAPAMAVAVDAHWVYDEPAARRLARGLADRGALFLEAPLAPEDIDGHARLARSADLPIAVGEAMRNRYEFRDWFARGAIGLAQPDVGRTGLTEAWVIADLASAYHVPVAPHHSVGLGPLLAAGVHLAAALPDCPFFEYQPATVEVVEAMLLESLDGGPDGFALPTAPGLGIRLDPTWLQAHTTSRTTVTAAGTTSWPVGRGQDPPNDETEPHP